METNGLSRHGMAAGQTLLPGLAAEDLLASEKPTEKSAPRVRPRAVPAEAVAEMVAAAVTAALGEAFAKLEARLDELESLIQEHGVTSHEATAVKAYYTTAEAASTLRKRPYTVREWCRLGRIRAEKANFGRGQDEEWRISHEELTRIQNEGLLPPRKDSRVVPPRRLPK